MTTDFVWNILQKKKAIANYGIVSEIARHEFSLAGKIELNTIEYKGSYYIQIKSFRLICFTEISRR